MAQVQSRQDALTHSWELEDIQELEHLLRQDADGLLSTLKSQVSSWYAGNDN